MTIRFTKEGREAYQAACNELAGLQRVRFIEAVQRFSDENAGIEISADAIEQILSSEAFVKRPQIIIKKNKNGKQEGQ